MKTLALIGREFLKDLVKLKLPVTAASVVATAVALLDPFGIDIGTATPVLTGACVAVGTVAFYVDSLRKRAGV